MLLNRGSTRCLRAAGSGTDSRLPRWRFTNDRRPRLLTFPSIVRPPLSRFTVFSLFPPLWSCPAVRGAALRRRRRAVRQRLHLQVAAVVDGGKVARSALVTAEVPCAFMVTPLRRDVLWTAGAEQVAVTTAPGCVWTAASESGFLAVTSGTMGTGPATVSYTVPPRLLLPTAPPAAPGRDG